MSRSRQGPRIHIQSGGWTPVRRITQTGWNGAAISVVLVIVVAAFAFALSLQQHGNTQNSRSASASTTPTATTAIYNLTPPAGKPLAHCGGVGQPACGVDPGWVDLPSDSPAVVAQVIASSAGYSMMTGHFGGAGLDTPVLVHAYPLHTGVEYNDNDHWVVTAHDASGLEVGIYDWVYDRAHHRMRLATFGAINPTDPRAHHPFPYTAAATAASLLHAARGVGLMAGRQPELMFFPIDPRWGIPNSTIHWSGGGEAALDPMWHVVGADARDYYVGVDSRVYVQSDLPLAPGRP